MNIRNIIGIVILVIVAVILFPLIQDTIGPMAWDNYNGNGETSQTNGSTQTLLQQIPLFYVLGVALAVIGFAIYSVRGLT